MKRRLPYGDRFSKMNRIMSSTVITDFAKNVGVQVGKALAKKAYESMTGTQTDSTKRSGKRANVSQGYLAGKVRPDTKTSKKLVRRVRKNGKKKKVSTRFGLQSYGIHYVTETRWVSKTDTIDKFESIQVGHTSMPGRVVLLGLCRAMVKQLFKKFRIKEFTDACTNDPYNLNAGDVIDLVYYDNFTTNTEQVQTYSISAGLTWEAISVGMYTILTENIGPKVLKNTRFFELRYKPQGGSWNQPYSMDLTTAKFEVEIKSALKIQNRTINSAGNDQEDDVDNVPLTGYLYELKGNNMWNRTFKSGLKGIGTGATASNDTVLYETFIKSGPFYSPGADGVAVQYAPTAAPFARPSEPPKPYELYNCMKSSKIRLNPGAIQTSVLNQKYKLDFTYLIKLLLEDFNCSVDLTQAYNPRKGLCRVFHLEKVIGSDVSSVSIGVENQFDLWARMISKPQGKFTNTIQVQEDFGVVG